MKKYYLLFILWCISASALFAQTSININSHSESFTTCTLPSPGTLIFAGSTDSLQVGDSVQVYISFGDGDDTTRMVPLYALSSSSSQFQVIGLSHTYQASGMYTVTYMVTAPSNVTDTLTTYLMITTNCTGLSGRIYYDYDNSCTYSLGDTAYLNQSVRLVYNGITVSRSTTVAGGLFVLAAEPGYTYELFNGGTSAADPELPLTCGTSQGMSVFITPTPVVQDLIVDDSTFVHIGQIIANPQPNSCIPYLQMIIIDASIYGYSFNSDSVTCYLNFGDGTDSTFRNPISSNLSNSGLGYLSRTVFHTYTANGNYSLLCKVTADDGTVDSMIFYNAVNVTDTCGNISGRAFLDNNNDCIFNAGDSLYASMPIDAIQNNVFHTRVYTNAQGEYNMNLQPGTYEIEAGNGTLQNFGLTTTCPSSGSYTITVTGLSSDTADFGMSCPSSFELTGSMSLGVGIFPTQPGYLIASIQNLSCIPVTGTVQLVLDPQVNFMGASNPPPNFAVNGDTLFWSLVNPPMYGNYSLFNVMGDPSLQVGDSVCFQLRILPVAGDLNPANNFITRCYEAFVAYDPNQKSVLPEGTGPGNDVLPGTVLDYTIQFQNTGNAPARDIFILDTLDASLDLSTMVVTGYSHYMETDLLPGNVIRFNFPEIWLPDSVNNEPLSHGFVSYRIGHLPNVPLGTTIENTANIYFDFNPPIVTNTTLNTIQVPSGVLEGNSASGFKLFPNPGKESFQVDFGKPVSGTVSLVDITGRIVMQKQLFAEQLIRVDAAAFPAGIYSFIYNDGENSRMQKVVITK